MGIFDNFVYKEGENVDNNWVKWFHWGIPDEESKDGIGREKICKNWGIVKNVVCCQAVIL